VKKTVSKFAFQVHNLQRYAEGEAYGDVLVRAYLDEEYFEHLHGGNAKVGRCRLNQVDS
jgi:hypothetical protein